MCVPPPALPRHQRWRASTRTSLPRVVGAEGHTRAAIQPITVQPRSRLTRRIAVMRRCSRQAAITLGRKWTNTPASTVRVKIIQY
jgi:hypothetical protein